VRKSNAEIIAITTDGLDAVMRMAKRLKLSFPIAVDQKKSATASYYLLEKPAGKAKTTTIIVDGEGDIRWVHTGKSTSDHPSALEILYRLKNIS